MRYPSPNSSRWRPAAPIFALAVFMLAAALAAPAEPAAEPGGAQGPLDELNAAMQEAQGLLEQGETGEPVQRVQEDIVHRLDALIAFAEAGLSMPPNPKAKERMARAERPAETTGPPEKPAERSTLPGGTWAYGRMRAPAEAEEAWLPQLPPTERKAIADALRAGRLPPRYRELLRQYNRRLAEEEPGAAEPAAAQQDGGSE